LVTGDEELAGRARALREHGQRRKYEHDVEGYTARLDTIQAIVLLQKLPLLDGWNEERHAAAAFYSQALEGVGDLVLPPVAPGSGRRSWRPSRPPSPVPDGPVNDAPYRLLDDVRFGEGVVVHAFTNLYGCSIGDGTRVGTFVEIQRGASVGARCKIQSHTFIC